jgi:hypothetical protein
MTRTAVNARSAKSAARLTGALAIGVGGLGFLASALCFSRRSLAGTPASQQYSKP